MCLIDTPTTSNTASSQKDLPVLRNTWLDGVDPALKGTTNGAASLRIDRSADVQTTGTNAGAVTPSSTTITRLSDFAPLNNVSGA